jgi:hypothetical protein
MLRFWHVPAYRFHFGFGDHRGCRQFAYGFQADLLPTRFYGEKAGAKRRLDGSVPFTEQLLQE